MALQGVGLNVEASKRGLWYMCCCGDEPISLEPELAAPEPEAGVSAAKGASKPAAPVGTTAFQSARLSDDGICLAFERGSPATRGRAVPAVAGDGPDGHTPPAASLASWLASTAVDTAASRVGMGSRGAPRTTCGEERAGAGGGGRGGVRVTSDPGIGMLGGRKAGGGEGEVSASNAGQAVGAVAAAATGAAAAAAGATLSSLVKQTAPGKASGAATGRGAPGGPISDDSAKEAWPWRPAGAGVEGHGGSSQHGVEGGAGRSGSGSDAEGCAFGHKPTSGGRGTWNSGLAEGVGALVGAQTAEVIRVMPSRAAGGAHGPSPPGGGGWSRRVAGPAPAESALFWAVGGTQVALNFADAAAEMFVEGLPK